MFGPFSGCLRVSTIVIPKEVVLMTKRKTKNREKRGDPYFVFNACLGKEMFS